MVAHLFLITTLQQFLVSTNTEKKKQSTKSKDDEKEATKQIHIVNFRVEHNSHRIIIACDDTIPFIRIICRIFLFFV